MSTKTFMEQIEAAETPVNTTNDCTISLPELKERLNPVVDHLKQSAFHPEVLSYVILDAKYRQDKSYSIGLNAKYFDSELKIDLWRHDAYTDEARRFIKSLNALTADMLEFMDKHHIRTAEVV